MEFDTPQHDLENQSKSEYQAITKQAVLDLAEVTTLISEKFPWLNNTDEPMKTAIQLLQIIDRRYNALADLAIMEQSQEFRNQLFSTAMELMKSIPGFPGTGFSTEPGPDVVN